MEIKRRYEIALASLIAVLMISNIFVGIFNADIAAGSLGEQGPLAEHCTPSVISTLQNHYIVHSGDAGPRPLSGTELDQYQTYGDCWVGTNYYVIKLAQSFKPTVSYLDYVQLKLWINFTDPVIGITFYIYDNSGGLPGSVIAGGVSPTYSSSDFLYSATVPNPNNDYQSPWYTIEFTDDPQVSVGQTYWIVMAITEHLAEDKHVFLAAEYNGGELYPQGCLAYYSDDYQWNTETTIDLMFKTYGYTGDNGDPIADAGGPYFGFIGGGEEILFDGSNSYDGDEGGQSIEQYDWKFFEGDTWHNNLGSAPSHTYGTAGTYIATLRVHDDEEETDTDTAEVTIYPPGPPHVNYISSFYADGSEDAGGKGLLLQGMNLTNTYKASVSGANIDKVKFIFDSQTSYDTNGNDGWTFTMNTEDILNPSTTLQVQAHNPDGWSSVYESTPKIIPIAGWLVQFIEYVCDWNDTDFASFSIGVKDHPPKLKNNYWTLDAAVDFSFGSPEDPDESPVEAGVDVPVDDVGGNYNYSGGIGSSVSICSDGTIDVTGSFQASISAKSVSGNIGASLHGLLVIGDEIVWEYMYLTINGDVTIPVFYIPFEVCGIGVEAGITITPHVEITFHLDPTINPNGGIVPGLGIKLKDDEGIEGNVGATVRAYAEAGFVIGEFYAEAGGDGTLYFQTPSPPGYFEDFILSCWIGGKIRFLFWTVEGWWYYDWSYSGQKTSSKEYIEESWAPLDRDYINPVQGTYNDFVWDGSGESFTMINNVFPHANPCLAYFPNSAGNKVMIVWSHDDPTKPRVKGMELQYTIWERDEDMDAPQPISGTTDTRLQMDPTIAFDGNGNVVCVFVQTDTSVSETSAFTEVCNATEIAYSIWDCTTETWGSIQTITANTHMDVSPILTSNADGDVVLIWITDTDNDHTTIADRSIYASFWDGISWSTPLLVIQNQPLASTPQIAITNDSRDDNMAICAFTMDADHDLTTADDQNIFYTTFSPGSPSGNIIQFTTDFSHQDTSPSVVYGQDGNPYIVWLKNDHEDYQGEEIHTGTLYYKQVGSARETAHAITTGSISDPKAIHPQASCKFDEFNFAVGWGGGESSDTLQCAKIMENHDIESGVIYGSPAKMSETFWSIAPGSITASTIERPTLKYHNKHCNLSFIYAQGFDEIAPETECLLDGEIVGYGEYGPIYKGDVVVSFEAIDEGYSGLDTTCYRLDSGAEQEYDGEPIVVSTKKPHVVMYYSIDKAANREETRIAQFQIVETLPPEKPIKPAGPTTIKNGEAYTYSTRTTDPDDDQVYYMWDWGDEYSDWLGPFGSGDTVEFDHTWEKRGTYEIKVRAKDIYNEISNWSDPLPITVPKSRIVYHALFFQFLERFFDRFPHAFPLMRALMDTRSS
ncbi:MAG: PKD domain-containing protein [Candidatus Thermoplasmatota archaeon]|nr:PKD domain-containing protein [Candidatus Thermoplasmatota archaeon]